MKKNLGPREVGDKVVGVGKIATRKEKMCRGGGPWVISRKKRKS